MSPQRFDHLLTLVGPRIRKNDANFREAIPPAERLATALRFLASGESQHFLAFLFCLGRSTISQIITETCDAIYPAFLTVTYTLHARPMTGLIDRMKPQKISVIYGTFCMK